MTFGERFIQSQGKQFEHEGQMVHAGYRLKSAAPLGLRLRWIRCIDSPTQGVSISVKGGHLAVAATTTKRLVLWRDTAPDEVAIRWVGKGLRELVLWNCWRDERGVTQAWIGNAGMLVDDLGAGVLRLRCNSRSAVTFEDLVVEIEVEGP